MFWNRVKPAPAQGMAARQTPERQQRAAQHSMPGQRFGAYSEQVGVKAQATGNWGER